MKAWSVFDWSQDLSELVHADSRNAARMKVAEHTDLALYLDIRARRYPEADDRAFNLSDIESDGPSEEKNLAELESTLKHILSWCRCPHCREARNVVDR